MNILEIGEISKVMSSGFPNEASTISRDVVVMMYTKAYIANIAQNPPNTIYLRRY